VWDAQQSSYCSSLSSRLAAELDEGTTSAPWEAAQLLKALSTTSVTRCEVCEIVSSRDVRGPGKAAYADVAADDGRDIRWAQNRARRELGHDRGKAAAVLCEALGDRRLCTNQTAGARTSGMSMSTIHRRQ
jgi:hypothetical protein